MKKLIKSGLFTTLLLAVAVVAAAVFVDPSCLMGMGFITNASEYNGKENEDVILRPVFTGPDVKGMGIKVIFTGRAGSVKLTFFSALSKILKAYASGFQGEAGLAGKLQKKFTLAEFKAEAKYSKQDYKNTILELVTNRPGFQNDITGTAVLEAEQALFQAAIKADVLRLFWLADTTKKFVLNGLRYDSSANVSVTYDSNTGVYSYVSGGADIYYNVINGVWKNIFADASTSPNRSQVKRIALSNGTVAQVTTATLTGTSGTANLIVNGVSYLATFTTNLTTSAANFVTTHAAALLALDIVVTSSGAGVIFTSNIAGQPFSAVTVANVSGDLSSTIVATTANTPAQDLAADEAQSTMALMMKGAPKELKALLPPTATTFEGTDKGVANAMINAATLRFYCTNTWIENYMETLETDGTEQARSMMIDGVERLTYRGIPLIPMGIDTYIANDFISPYPHRCILSTPENLVLVINGQSEGSETKMWFNPDENENRQRTQFEMGANYFLPELMVAAY